MAQIIIARWDFSSSKQSCTGSVTRSLRGFSCFSSRFSCQEHHQPISPKADSFPVRCAGRSKFLASTPTPASILLCDHNAPNWVRISLRALALCISFCRSTVVAASLSALSTCPATRSTSCLAAQDSGVWTSSGKPLANLSRLSALDTTSFSVDTHHSSSSALRTQRAQLAVHAPSLRSTVIAAINSRIWSSMETGENGPDKPRQHARSPISEIRDTDGISNATHILQRWLHVHRIKKTATLRVRIMWSHVKARSKSRWNQQTRVHEVMVRSPPSSHNNENIFWRVVLLGTVFGL